MHTVDLGKGLISSLGPVIEGPFMNLHIFNRLGGEVVRLNRTLDVIADNVKSYFNVELLVDVLAVGV